MLDDIALFVHIVQSRGLGSAARKLKVPAATITRRLQKLEEQIGARLIHRSARRFVLTAEGEAYYEAFANLVHEFEGTSRSLSEDLRQLSGRLAVMAPLAISIGSMKSVWSDFIRQHPEIQLDLGLNNQNVDLLTLQVDLALRIGPQSQAGLSQKRLGTISTVLAAAPDYLAAHGLPAGIEDLSYHRIVGVHVLQSWELRNTRTGARETLRLSAHTAVDDVAMARHLLIDGLGISLMPVTEIVEDLAAGRLVQVLPAWQGQQREVFAVWPTGRLLSARAKCLREFLETRIGREPVLQGEVPEVAGGVAGGLGQDRSLPGRAL